MEKRPVIREIEYDNVDNQKYIMGPGLKAWGIFGFVFGLIGLIALVVSFISKDPQFILTTRIIAGFALFGFFGFVTVGYLSAIAQYLHWIVTKFYIDKQ